MLLLLVKFSFGSLLRIRIFLGGITSLFGVKIRLGLLACLHIFTNNLVLQVALFIYHGNNSEMRITIHYTHIWYTSQIVGSSLLYL